MTTSRRRPAQAIAKGLSIIELMIGVTIGLFILAGATLVASTQLADNRRMLLETQLQQDLRATADLVTRDLRMASYWAHAWRNVWPTDFDVALSNPYTTMTVTNTSVKYDRSIDESSSARSNLTLGFDNDVVDSDERVGFRFNSTNKTIEMLVSSSPENWQALTDPNVVEITQFDVNVNVQNVPVPCGEACITGPGGCVPQLEVRNASVVISARAVHDNTIRRSVQSDVRLRNDVLVCP